MSSSSIGIRFEIYYQEIITPEARLKPNMVELPLSVYIVVNKLGGQLVLYTYTRG